MGRYWIEAQATDGEWSTIGTEPYPGESPEDALAEYRRESGDTDDNLRVEPAIEGRTWQVIEDNGGGLTLYVWDAAEALIYAHTGYEYTPPQQLRDDLAALASGERPETWEGNDLINPETIQGVRGDAEADTDCPLTHAEYYPGDEALAACTVIFDQDGPCKPAAMGAAGRLVFAPGCED